MWDDSIMLKCSSETVGMSVLGRTNCSREPWGILVLRNTGSKRESRGVAVKGRGWDQAGHHRSRLLLQNWVIATHFPPPELIAICVH